MRVGWGGDNHVNIVKGVELDMPVASLSLTVTFLISFFFYFTDAALLVKGFFSSSLNMATPSSMKSAGNHSTHFTQQRRNAKHLSEASH